MDLVSVINAADMADMRGSERASLSTPGNLPQGLVPDVLLDGLNDAQRRACAATDGPVRIIAGAGAGKTRTVTRRIAYACATGRWDPARTLAVTFSVKAAGELRRRLDALHVPSTVRAATFHSEALRQLRRVWPELTDLPFPQILEDPLRLASVALTRVSGSRQPDPGQVRDVLAEINWAKVGLVTPQEYAKVCAAMHRTPPAGLDAQHMGEAMRAYESEKAVRNLIDFNDILLLMCHVLDSFGDVASAVRERVGWLTVDEYQDVSPLQHRLMTLWLGSNRQVCVVGDPAQTIYSFAGATGYYLLHFDREYAPVSGDVELATDFRSTSPVVRYANRVLAASPQRQNYMRLSAVRRGGSRVVTMAYDDDEAQAQAVARHIARLIAQGMRPGQCAVLSRINAQQPPVCKALRQAGVAYQVRSEQGADPFDPARVMVCTLHAAKGLEFRHVFIIGCSEGLIPFGSPQSGETLEEERRLFYVGVTRAMDALHLSFAASKDGQGGARRMPSRFLNRG